MGLEAHLDSSSYLEHGKENALNYWLSTEASKVLTASTQLVGGALYRQAHEDRESPDSANGFKPTTYQEIKTYLGSRHEQGRFNHNIGATLERSTFDATATSAGMINNSDRDRNHITFGVKSSYDWREILTPQLQIVGDVRNYDAQTDDFSYRRSSKGGRATAGTRFKGKKK
ncbi:MAG: hypothetical protein COY40_03815 [Alphaproteobacteria bacterium CG_4_10_14_0_8_um_filter_53_9]|nr:MAG: hypothetical protein COY40_03815 [Alphaproteobacteria bacterium CG_4_10_14_0_8_um_filter_53_9]